MKIHKGDNVRILAGKDRGKSGRVLWVTAEDAKALVEGINLYKKHRRPRKQGEKGEIITVPRPLPMSRLQLVCPKCGKATRVGFAISGDKKTRVCKKCKNEI